LRACFAFFAFGTNAHVIWSGVSVPGLQLGLGLGSSSAINLDFFDGLGLNPGFGWRPTNFCFGDFFFILRFLKYALVLAGVASVQII